MELQKGLISVIMSTYNTSEEYLREAVESIIGQTYTDFEFIIIDDCSDDNPAEIINSYNDPRIILIRNEENLGITKSLNRALKISKGEYVARMDADDISFADRFEKQINFMKNNPSVTVCGTWIEYFGEGAHNQKNKYLCKTLPDRDTVHIMLLFGNHMSIAHPTAMFRHEALLNSDITYNENYLYAQDFRMWVECSKEGTLANVSEVLFKYRIHDNAVSVSKRNIQKECDKNIIAEQLSWLGMELTDDWEYLHFGLLTERKPYDLRFKEWIEKIILQNKIYKIYNQKRLEKMLWEKWSEIVYFEVYKAKGFDKLKALLTLPIKYYPNLFKIKKQRSKKQKQN